MLKKLLVACLSTAVMANSFEGDQDGEVARHLASNLDEEFDLSDKRELQALDGQEYRNSRVVGKDEFLYGLFRTKLQNHGAFGTSLQFGLSAEGLEDSADPEDKEIKLVIQPTFNQIATYTRINKDSVNWKEKNGGRSKKEMDVEIEWTPDEIIWRVDAKEIRSMKNKSGKKMQDAPMRLTFINQAATDYYYSQGFSDDKLPAQAYFDYVEVYYYNEDGSFTYGWRDDFDTWDSKRWLATADPGFFQVRGSFTPENVAV